MKEEYFKKVYLSSGELPEKNKRAIIISKEYTGNENGPTLAYHDSLGWVDVDDILEVHGYIDSKVDYWLKPCKSPSEEAIEFAEWVEEHYFRFNNKFISMKYYSYKDRDELPSFTTSELYDKFKEENEK